MKGDGRHSNSTGRRSSLEAAGLRDGADASMPSSRWEAALRLQLVVTELMASPACSEMALSRRSAAA
jgi:hypothetical protein